MTHACKQDGPPAGGPNWTACGWLVVCVWPLFTTSLALVFLPTNPNDAGLWPSGFEDNCEAFSSLSYFVFLLLAVLLCSAVARTRLLPTFFPVHVELPSAQKLKAATDTVKILARILIMIMCLPMWSRMSLDAGLDLGRNCSDSVDVIRARRLFAAAKYLLMAVMAWELSFTPELSWDVYLHHLFTIMAVTLTTDPVLNQALTGAGSQNLRVLAYNDGYGLVLLFGGSLNWIKEVFILLYREHRGDLALQCAHLQRAVWAHAVNQLAIYIGLAVFFLVSFGAHGDIPDFNLAGLSALTVAFNILEGYILFITNKVATIKRRALDAQDIV